MYLGLGLPPTMKSEIYSAVNFVARLLQTTNRNVDPALVDNFSRVLVNCLCEKFDTHWFPEKPFKGSAYRCVRITQLGMDPVVGKAGEAVGMSHEALYNLLPHELTVWIDPSEVSYRIGEEGSICVLYDGSDEDSSSSSSSNMSDLSSSPPQYSQEHFSTSAADYDFNFNSPIPAFH
ncbi:protein BTG1 [Strongylocentrotus purpuratus]|uniref:Anti-proliferative protein domain-containing protein n=1 Tax=Strongylocentrotus purpuratus TaxID=7668 RepID=A0A7M7RDC1_STRPU|nr:protein BTG1 [Strongylocentrotus purpuratus]|eukprot:XP_786322.2 PREDICTED: protein BTG1-like [Strongylocentrotus purpuratus]